MFAETLVARLSKVSLLVVVLSPRYVKSEWCLKELGEFCNCAESGGGLTVGDKSRVFKVVKFHIPFEEHPPQLRGVLGYEFFEYDDETKRAREFNPDVTPARDIRYWEKLDDIAYDIKQMLDTLARPSAPPSQGEVKTVYLSETTSDLSGERDLIKRELQLQGHAVLTGDGKTLFIDKGDAVELWDIASRNRLRSIDKPSEANATAISPDGRLIALGGSTLTRMKLIDIATGQELRQLGGENDAALIVPDKEFEGGVSVVKFSPDGATLAVGMELSSVDVPEVTLWDVASRRRKAVFRDETSIASIAFSTDGSLIAVGGVGGSIRVWDASSSKEVCRRKQNLPISSVAFSPSGRYLAIGYGASSAATPVLLSLSECRSEPSSHIIGYSLEGTGTEAAGSVAFSPDDRLLAVSYGDNSVKVWEVASIKDGPVVAVKGHAGYINLAAFLPDSRTLLTAAEDGTINLWDTSALILEHETLSGHTGAVVGLAFSPDEQRLATASVDGSVRLWNWETRQELNTFSPSQTGEAHAVAFSPNGRTLAAGSEAGDHPSLRVWDPLSFEEQAPFDIRHDSILAVTFSPDGERVVSGGSKLRVWDASSHALLKEINAVVSHVAFSRDGSLFAAAQRGGVRLWDGALSKELKTFDVREVMSLAFSPDGRALAASSGRGFVKLWDTASGEELATLSGHNGGVFAVAFSPDGRALATGGEDATVKLWSTTSFKELVTLGGHTGAINSLAFSPDGRALASASFDRTVRLWRAATDEEVKARGSQ